MKLEDIGFYTLSDYRAVRCSKESPLWRCELIVSNRCNLRCPYCRPLREKASGTLTFNDAIVILDKWIRQGLKNVRFSGGEPTLWQPLIQCINMCRQRGVEKIAISTNGTASLDLYDSLLEAGLNDISISLDSACCSAGTTMNGGFANQWEKSIEAINHLSSKTYVTIGIVVTPENIGDIYDTVMLAHNAGVADIRLIPAAQFGAQCNVPKFPQEVLEAHPILRYRLNHFENQVPVRGLSKEDAHSCHLALDDMAVAGKYHWPCIIYLREGGDPIGKFGKNFRRHRARWVKHHDPTLDQICKANCLDVCRQYNNTAEYSKRDEC